MIQEILTYLIILITIVVSVRKIIRMFTTKVTACSNCYQAASGCKIAHLKEQIRKPLE